MDPIVEIVSKIGGLWLFLIVGAITWGVSAVVKALAKQHRLARQTEQMAVLKQSMIDRGMSADEIERVIVAGTADQVSKDAEPEKGPIIAMIEQEMEADEIEKVIRSGVTTQESPDRLVHKMSEHGYGGDDIVKVLAALDRRPTAPAT